MNENTERLLRELAAKLGTTTEHLYSVLVKQAKVNIIKSIITIISIGVTVLILWHFTGCVHWIGSEQICLSDIIFAFAWISFGVSLVMAIIQIPTEICNIAEYAMNPEKQAIDYIMDLFNND